MAKKSWIVSGIGFGGVILGVVVIGGNSLINQYVQKEFEKAFSDGTGLKVNCAEANVNLFTQSIKIRDIRFNNLEGFSSPYIFKIGGIEMQSENLNTKPLNWAKMIIKDVEINIDTKFSNNPAQPQKMMLVNVQEMQQRADNQAGTKKSSSPKPDLIIQQMLLENIQVNINAQFPQQSNSVKEQFKIQEISLNDLNNENLPQKLSTALQEQISVEVKKHLSQKNTPQLNQILKPLIDLMQQNSSSLSLPGKPSIPQPPKPPTNPSLSLPGKPSIPQPPKPPTNPSLSLPGKPSIPQPPKPPTNPSLSLPGKPSIPQPQKPPANPSLSLPKKPSIPQPQKPPANPSLSLPGKPSIPQPQKPPANPSLSLPGKPSPPSSTEENQPPKPELPPRPSLP